MTPALADLHVDATALRASIDAELEADVADLSVIADGLNLVLSVSTTSDRDAYVVRSPRKLRDASYMNDLRTEHAVLERLADGPVPTPDPVAFCGDDAALGEPFVVLERVPGDVVPLGSDLPARFRTPGARERVADALVDVLASIHGLDADRFEDVLDRHSPREQVERSRDRLAATTDATGLDVPRLHAVGDWLREHAPPGGAVDATLVHGDYRPGNAVFAPGGDPEIPGVLDWETVFVGDPLTELGYLLLRWRDPGDPTPDLDAIAARYPDHDDELSRLRRVNADGFAPFTSSPGSPTRGDLVARYEAATGREFTDARFYLALAAFDLATVWTDLHRDAVEAGRDSAWPPHVAHLARVAELVVDGDLVA
ncbi:phosphotransferase family protein [Halorubellus sp. PRR65]|uniref:phosphotransferase family protein n=1 Tax=Halorubellus sp. PRR65 TaxID=3098148 RepID=UPI002B26226E|nr:phosphotransferase family protein [Halorubellus sp. PRR65]